MESQANETQQQSNPTPWNQDFMNMFGFKQEAPSGASSPTPQKSLFQRVWESVQPPPPRVVEDTVTAAQPTRGSRSAFESTFDRLLQQESRKTHTDKNGKLITSSAGAQGITQIMPETGKKPGYGIKPLQDDSEGEYLRVGRELLQAYTKSFDGDIRKGLAAYNAGPGKVKTLLTKHGEQGWESQLPKETRDYLKKITGQ